MSLTSFTGSRWALLAVLVVQVALSAHLIWANTAFHDEALYLLSGQLEWSHWIHGTPVPQFQTYFSGAPVLYPPLGAAADAIGGLAAARALSLCLMLVATTVLHGVAKRLFDRRAAALAAALFAGVGATQYLGAFATYDALALMLLALATWLGVRAAGPAWGRRVPLLILAGLALAAADAAKYAVALFDAPAVLTAALFIWQQRGCRSGISAGLLMSGTATLGVAAAILAGGNSYWQGITFTTVTRASGTSGPIAVLLVSAGWAGAIAGLAAVGAITVICRSASRARWALGVVLAGTVWLAGIEEARLHTFTSLFKHVGFGEWFGAILGGFALAALSDAVPLAKIGKAICTAWLAVAASACIGTLLATNQFAAWPDITGLVAALRPLLKHHRNSVLAADNGNVIQYYLARAGLVSTEKFIGEQAQWEDRFTGQGFEYRPPGTGVTRTGLVAYNLAIKNGYFNVITLSNYHAWRSADVIIRQDIKSNGDYRLVSRIPYSASGNGEIYQIWAYRGPR